MKKIYACVLLPLLLAACSTRETAQPLLLNDLEKRGLHGPVQSIEHVLCYAVAEADGTFSVGDTVPLKTKEWAGILEQNASLRFNPDGNLTRIRTPEDSVIRRHIYHYDDSGRLCTVTDIRRDGLEDSTVYFYDRRGELRKQKIYMASAPFRIGITGKYTYSKQDTLDVVTIKTSLLPFIPTHRGVRGYKDSYNYFFESYRGKELMYSGQMFYNDRGWKSKEILTKNKYTGIPSIDLHYDYIQIDDRGNWTRRLTYCYQPHDRDGDPLYTYITLREITYFPEQESE